MLVIVIYYLYYLLYTKQTSQHILGEVFSLVFYFIQYMKVFGTVLFSVVVEISVRECALSN